MSSYTVIPVAITAALPAIVSTHHLRYHGGGGSWLEHGVTRAQVLRRMAPIETGAPALWPTVLRVIERSVAAGWIASD